MKPKNRKKEKVQESFTVTVKVKLEYDSDKDYADVIDEVQQEVNYQFKYRRNGIHIVGSEIQEVTL